MYPAGSISASGGSSEGTPNNASLALSEAESWSQRISFPSETVFLQKGIPALFQCLFSRLVRDIVYIIYIYI